LGFVNEMVSGLEIWFRPWILEFWPPAGVHGHGARGTGLPCGLKPQGFGNGRVNVSLAVF
jgi:hypothetical protein